MGENVIRLFKEGRLTEAGLKKALLLGWIDQKTYEELTAEGNRNGRFAGISTVS